MLPKLADSTSILGFDLANEPAFNGVTVDAPQRWLAWLKERHGNIETLNDRWRTHDEAWANVPVPVPEQRRERLDNWKVLAQLTPDASQEQTPWADHVQRMQSRLGDTQRVIESRRFDTGMQDLKGGAVDVWIKPTASDFGQPIVEGGDLKKPFVALRLRLTADGHVVASHWTWPAKAWVPDLGSSEAAKPGEWVRVTYSWGNMGQHLFVNGKLVASNPSETRRMAWAFTFEASELEGQVGHLTVISGSGYRP